MGTKLAVPVILEELFGTECEFLAYGGICNHFVSSGSHFYKCYLVGGGGADNCQQRYHYWLP